MSKSDKPLTFEARFALDAHLDAIDQVLRDAGTPRSERQSICDEVEMQVREIVSSRTSGEPKRSDVLAVLAEMDAPESYLSMATGNADLSQDGGAMQAGRVLRSALGPTIVAAIGGLTVYGLFVFRRLSEDMTVMGLLTLVATGSFAGYLGWRYFENRSYRTQQRAFVLAFFGMIFIPLLLTSVMPTIMTDPILENVFGFKGELEASAQLKVKMALSLCMLTAAFNAVVVSVLSARFLSRFV